MSAKRPKKPAPFPTKSELLEFISGAEGRIGKREIARAFQIRGNDKIRLKRLLREMADDGLLAKDGPKSLHPAGRLPSVTVVRVTGIDRYGELMAEPQRWEGGEPPPRIFIAESKRRRGRALGQGDRALVRLRPEEDEEGLFYSARIIRVLPAAQDTVLGRYEGGEKGGRIIPGDRRVKQDFLVQAGDVGGAKHGTLVLAEIESGRGSRSYGLRRARVTECLGDLGDPRSISLISIHHHGLPMKFDAETLSEAEAAPEAAMEGRADLRHVPFVTIDPADARDHDDAVYAEAETAGKNAGGWRIMVAIADVAFYVRPGSALEREALRRGNSCYFPDRVVPMLPERLSADLCSLMPDVDRPAMVAHIGIDAEGNTTGQRFERAMIRSRASLTYQQTQAAMDGSTGEDVADLLEPVIRPLYGAYGALLTARARRGPLDLDLPERRIELDQAGNVASVRRQERLDSHRLVEEFMIAANVAAAVCLEEHHSPCMYRVHEEPGLEKLESLRAFLSTLKLKLAKGQVLRPSIFNNILKKAAGTEYAELVNQLVLRSQTQAFYSPGNLGHFGLALPRYAHFTSPIRRYADLIVHRSLIRALKLGTGGLTDEETLRLEEEAEQISNLERRAMAAERESKDRYLAAYLSDQVGKTFDGKISGVARFGLFVTIEPTGADGFIPASSLSGDYYVFDEDQRRLRGRKSGKSFRLGDKLEVRLREADALTGSLRLELMDEIPLPDSLMKRRGRKSRGRKKTRRPKK